MYAIIFFFLNIQVEIGNYDLYLYAAKILSWSKGRFFRLKLTFELIQSHPNEFSSNRKIAPTPHGIKTDVNRCRCM